MAVTPRRSLDDYLVDNMACSICGRPSLQVKKVNNLPDFVVCSTCQAAFLVEQGGPRVLYGQIPESYPETKAYALKKWLLREAVDLQALKERPSPAPTAGQPEALAEAIAPSMPEDKPAETPSADALETKEPVADIGAGPASQQPSTSEESEGPPSFSGVYLGGETPAKGLQPVQPPSSESPMPIGQGTEAADARPVEVQPGIPGDEKVESAIPEGLELNIDLPTPDQFPTPDPSPAEIEEPDWLRPADESPLEPPKSPNAETVQMPEDPFLEQLAAQDEVEAIEEPAMKDPHNVKHGIEWPSTTDDDLDMSNLPDWLRPQEADSPRDTTPDLSNMPGVPIPTEPISEPAESGIALESQPRLKPRHYDTLPPQPGTPTAQPGRQPPSDLPPAPAPSPQEDISRPTEESGPGFKLTTNDPVPGERYRVVIKGVKVRLPTDFCAHCGRSPVRGRVVVTGSLPSSKILGQRQATQFNVPLCDDCLQRSQHPKEEVQSARLQASLVSTLVAVIVLVLGLVFGLVNLRSTSIPNLMILFVLAAIGYAIPAVILFGRIQDLPVTPEMHYIQTTLIVPNEAQGLETAFEWRSPLYAQRFAEMNQQNVVGNVSQIKQRPIL